MVHGSIQLLILTQNLNQIHFLRMKGTFQYNEILFRIIQIISI